MDSKKVANRTARPFGNTNTSSPGYSKVQQIGLNYGGQQPVNLKAPINTDKKTNDKSQDNGGAKSVQLEAPTAPRRRSIAYIELSPASPQSPNAKPAPSNDNQPLHNGFPVSKPQNLPDVVNTGSRKPQLNKQMGYDNDQQPAPNPNVNTARGQGPQSTPSAKYFPTYTDNRGIGLDYRNHPKPSIYEYTSSAYDGATGGSSRGRKQRSGSQGTEHARRQSGSQGQENRRSSGSQGQENRRSSGSQGQDPGNRRRSGSQEGGGGGGGRRRRSGSQGQDARRRRSGSQGGDQYYRRSSGHGGGADNRGQQDYSVRRRSGSQGKEVFGQTIRRRSGSQGKEYVNSHRNSGSGSQQSRSWSRGSGAYDRYEDTDTTGDEQQIYSGKSQYFYNKQYGNDPPDLSRGNSERQSGFDQQRSGRITPDHSESHRHRRQRMRPVSNPDVPNVITQNIPPNSLQNQAQKPSASHFNVPQINVQPDSQTKVQPEMQKHVPSPAQPSTMFQTDGPPAFNPLQVDTAKYNPNSGVIVHGSSKPQTPAQTRRRSYSVCAVITPESPVIPISPSSVKSTVKIPMLRSRPSSRAASPSPGLFSPPSIPFLNPYSTTPGSRSVDEASGYRSDSGISNYQQQLSPMSSDGGGLLSPPTRPPYRGCTPVRVICQNTKPSVQSPSQDDAILYKGPAMSVKSTLKNDPISQQQSRPMNTMQQAPVQQAPAQQAHVPSQYQMYQYPQRDAPQYLQSMQPAPPQMYQYAPQMPQQQVPQQQVPQQQMPQQQMPQQQMPQQQMPQQQMPQQQMPQQQMPQQQVPPHQPPPAPQQTETGSRRYSEPAATNAVTTNTQSSSTFEPRLLMSRRQRRRRSRPLSTCSDENAGSRSNSRSGSVENVNAAAAGQLTMHQQRVQAYNQQHGTLPSHTTSANTPTTPTTPTNTLLTPQDTALKKPADASPTDWATITEMEYGKPDPSSVNTSYADTYSQYSRQQQLAPSQQLSSEPEKSPEEQAAAKQAALEAARMRRRRSRELNMLSAEQRQVLAQQPLGLQQQTPSSGRTTPSGRITPQSPQSSTRPHSGQRVRRRARSFNAFTTGDPMAPPPEMSARVRTRPESAGRSTASQQSQMQPQQQHQQQQLNTSLAQSQQQHTPYAPPQQQHKSPTQPQQHQQTPPEPPPRKHYPPPPDYETAVKLSPAPKHLRPMSLPVPTTMSSSSDEMPSPDPKHKSRRHPRRRSREHSKGEMENIDSMLDMALDNLREAKVSDKQLSTYGNDAVDKARSRRRLRRRDWIPDHHVKIEQSSEASEVEIDEEYEKVRRTASELQSPASSSGRNTPFHDEQQLNQEYEKIKRLLGYDRGPDSPKLVKQAMRGAQSCIDMSKVGVGNGDIYRSESTGNLRNEITDLVSPTNGHAEVVNDKKQQQQQSPPKGTKVKSLPPLEEEAAADGQSRKKRTKNKARESPKEAQEPEKPVEAAKPAANNNVPAASKEATPEPIAKAPAAEAAAAAAAPEAPAAPAEVCNGTDSAPAPAPAPEPAPSTEEATPAPAPAPTSSSLESAIERGEKLEESARNASPPTMDDVTDHHRPKEAFPEYQQQRKATEETKKEESGEEKKAVEAEPEAAGAVATDDAEEECQEEEEEEATNGASGSDEAADSQNKIVLKYEYKDDQWSPLNPEGKKNYDRSFLLKLQFDAESTKKPTGLNHLPDIILDAPVGPADKRSAFGGKGDFTPGFVQGVSNSKPPVRGGGGSKRGSQQRNRGPPMPGVKVISIDREKAALHKTDNAWTPSYKQPKNAESMSQEELECQEVFRTVKAMLNKLTPTNFDRLVGGIMKANINSERKLKGAIDLIFEKAIDEPSFVETYGKLANAMTALKVPSAANPAEEVLFRNLLLNRCQREFEKDKTDAEDMERRQKEIDLAPEEDKKRLREEMDLKALKDRRRSLGNIRFIGELFKLKMLTDKIMHDCIVRMLKTREQENIECLVKLLETIGVELDRLPRNKSRIDQYFTQLKSLQQEKLFESRVRFNILDLCELRERGWVLRDNQKNKGPTTIAAIHNQAQQEEADRQQLVARLQRENQNMGGGQHGGRGGGGARRGQQGGAQGGSDDGWITPLSSRGNTNRIDIEKMLNFSKSQKVDANSVQLGPQGRGGKPQWGAGAGSRGGSNSNSKNSSREKEGGSNRFSALSDGTSASAAPAYSGRGSASRNDSRDGRRGGGSLQGRSRGGARASMEHDREAALSAARNLGGGNMGPGSRNQSRESSRDGRRSESQEMRRPTARPPPAQAAAAAPAEEAKALITDREAVQRKTRSLLDEYLQIHDLQEAIACTRELDPSVMNVFVGTIIESVLEKSDVGRRMVGQLLHNLIKASVLPLKAYCAGVLDILEYADDMAIDIPKFWEYVGQIVAPMVQPCLAVPLSFLETIVQPLAMDKRAKLLAFVLNTAVSELGHDAVGNMWRSSGLEWEKVLGGSADQVKEYVDKYNLGFTLGQTEPKSPDGKHLSPEKIQRELDRLVITEGAENMDVIDWIFANVGEAHVKEASNVRAIVTSVCMSSIVDGKTVNTEKLKKRMNLIQRFIDHNDKLELQALFAVQALVHKLEHPSGVLRSLFDTLYDEDVISEEAFYAWDASEEEMAGKGVAASSVKQFFTWLQNADEVTEN